MKTTASLSHKAVDLRRMGIADAPLFAYSAQGLHRRHHCSTSASGRSINDVCCANDNSAYKVGSDARLEVAKLLIGRVSCKKSRLLLKMITSNG